MSEVKAVNLPVEEIEASAATQVRVRIDPRHVERLVEAIEEGAIVPPLVVFAEKGSHRYLLADGFHRLAAFKKSEIHEVACELHPGGIREALRYALPANNRHGLPRNNHDKRNAVMIALKDPEWYELGNERIARMCEVSETMVRNVRGELEAAGEIDPRETVRTIQDGKEVQQPARKSKGSHGANPSKKNKKSETNPPRPSPKTQDQANREEFLAALTAIRSIPHDGSEAVRRWQCQDRMEEMLYCRDFLNEMIEASKKAAA